MSRYSVAAATRIGGQDHELAGKIDLACKAMATSHAHFALAFFGVRIASILFAASRINAGMTWL